MVFSPHSPPILLSFSPIFPVLPTCRYSATLATSLGVDAVMGAKNANSSFLSLFKGSFEANAKYSSSLSEVIDAVVDKMPPARYYDPPMQKLVRYWGSSIAKCLRSANMEVRVASTRYYLSIQTLGTHPRVANTLRTEM